MPDLRNDIADALGVGHGTAGKVLQGVETYILADNYIAAHDDEDLSWPVLLHTGTGRRFEIQVFELASDTPPAPPGIGELTGEPVPAPGTFTPPEVLAQGPPLQPTSPDVQFPATPQPEAQIERPEPIQAPSHALQGEPDTNVDPEFFLKVDQIDSQIKPGEPLPPPAPVTPAPDA